MTISATIVTVGFYKGRISLMLDSDQILLITHHTHIPLVGQRITGDIGHCVVEGGGGERLIYARQGSFLREQEGQTDV